MDLKRKVKKVLAGLNREHADAKCALHYRTSFQLLVATILSAQCTDERVNKVTPELFQKYPSALDFARAQVKTLEQDIRSTGFYKNKAKAIQSSAQKICEKFQGRVPDKLEDLVELHGIGRKTANVVLGNAYGIPGITVDTHLKRVSFRLGLTRQTDPVKIEFELMKIIPRNRWTSFSHRMIFHGRRICFARNPDCPQCPFDRFCPKRGVTQKANRG